MSELKLNKTKSVSKWPINIYDFLHLLMITALASEVSLLRFLEQKYLSWSSVPYRSQLNDLAS